MGIDEQDLELPDAGLSFEPPLRMHHLTGGLSILSGANRLATLMAPNQPGMVFFSVLPGHSIDSSLLDHTDVRAIGFNHFSAAEEMHDPVTSNFFIAAFNKNNKCLAHSQALQWQGLATALHQCNRDSEAMLATRVASQVRLCTSRLERLSVGYRTVLSIVSSLQMPATQKLTGDKYALFLGSEYRSTLNELYSLRDAVLAAAFRILTKRTDSFDMKKFKQIVLNAREGSAKLISDSMFSSDGDLLIRNMSLYRSIAQHCLGATNPLFGDVYQLRASKGPFGVLPYLVYPLYDDIDKMREIEEGSSKGVLERLPIEESKRFLSLDVYQDALEFCFDCLERLLKISEVLEQEIGIEPKVTILTDKDILEITTNDGTGNNRRAKRDPATGRLVEY